MKQRSHNKTSTYRTIYLPWIICAVAAVFYSYEYLLRMIPSLIAEELMQFHGIGAAALGNLVAFYYYAYTPMQFPVGILMDRFNPKYLLAFACTVCATGTFLFSGMSQQLYLAGAGRFLMGFGSAFAFVGVLKLATLWLPADRFALVSGLVTALGMLGAMVGDNSLISIIAHSGWQQTVLGFSYAGVVLTLLILFVIKSKPPHLIPAMSSEQQVELAPSVEPAQPIKGTAILTGLFHVLKTGPVWIAGVIGCLLFMSLSVFADFWGITYLKQAHGLTATQAASGVSMVFLGWAVGAPIVGWLSDWLHRRAIVLFWGALVAALAISLLLYYPGLPTYLVYFLLFIYGSFCAAEVVVFAISRENSPESLSGTAIAVTNTLVMLGGAVLLPLTGILLERFWSGNMQNGIPIYTVQDYRMALAFLPLGLLLAAGLSCFIKEAKRLA